MAHARYLHSSGKGKVTIAQKTDLEPPDDWNQSSHSLEQLYEVLPAYAGLNDVYITQNRFYGSRANNRVAELSAMYSDLDYYKVSDFAQRSSCSLEVLPIGLRPAYYLPNY